MSENTNIPEIGGRLRKNIGSVLKPVDKTNCSQSLVRI